MGMRMATLAVLLITMILPAFSAASSKLGSIGFQLEAVLPCLKIAQQGTALENWISCLDLDTALDSAADEGIEGEHYQVAVTQSNPELAVLQIEQRSDFSNLDKGQESDFSLPTASEGSTGQLDPDLGVLLTEYNFYFPHMLWFLIVMLVRGFWTWRRKVEAEPDMAGGQEGLDSSVPVVDFSAPLQAETKGDALEGSGFSESVAQPELAAGAVEIGNTGAALQGVDCSEYMSKGAAVKGMFSCSGSVFQPEKFSADVNKFESKVAELQGVDSSKSLLTAEVLSAPLGIAIGAVIAEVLEHSRGSQQQCFSADELSKVLEVAMESQLLPVVGVACNGFVSIVKQNFHSTVNTLWSVRQVLPHMKSCRSRQEPDRFIESPIMEPWRRDISTSAPSEVDDGTVGNDIGSPNYSCLDGGSGCAKGVRFAEDAYSDKEESYADTEDAPSGSMHDAIVLATSATALCVESPLQQALLDVLGRSVQAQEQRNYFKQIQIINHMRHNEEQLQLSQESNLIMRQTVDLNRQSVALSQESIHLSLSRALSKEKQVEEKKLKAAYLELSKRCADDLVAGLCVMILALGYGGWHYSYERLSKVVSSCQPTFKEPRRFSWIGAGFYQSAIDSLTVHVRVLACEITVAGRMLIGTAIMVLVASLLLRRSVTNSSAAMPVSVIVIVLGVICGVAGKLSVDSLGGSGVFWLLIWEAFCLAHAFASCFTSSLYHCLNGNSLCSEACEPKKRRFRWLRRLLFHSTLVISLPLMAAIVPFASSSSDLFLLGF